MAEPKWTKKGFEYDPEEENKQRGVYRLPFALCKQAGITPEKWWTPHDAWEALKNGGYVESVSEEYKKYIEQKKKADAKERREYKKERAAQIKRQMANPEHVPDKVEHQEGAIAGVKRGAPMSHEQADSGNVNPFYGKIGEGETRPYIGYRTNCQTCVATYIARRQGYDVRALPNLNNESMYELSHRVTLAYDDVPEYKTRSKFEHYDAFMNENVKEGRIYALQVTWKGRRTGHIVCAERVGGNVRIYDPQTNITYEKKHFRDFFRNTESERLYDLTDAKMNESFCDKVMKRSAK